MSVFNRVTHHTTKWEKWEFPHGCRVTVPSCSICTKVFEENFYLVEFMPIKTKAIQK